MVLLIIYVLVSWCNGSIVDFESIDGGSIPPETVKPATSLTFDCPLYIPHLATFS